MKTQNQPCLVSKWALIVLLAAIMAALPNGPVVADVIEKSDSKLIDDFSSGSSESALGTMWLTFTDRVMGGVSDAAHTIESRKGVNFLRLYGDVSLENNGGFAQVALELQRRGQAFDATPYAGVRLTVRGDGGPYYIHFKNGQTPQHWNYFEASFDVSDEWQVVDIPFTAFKSERDQSGMDTSTLRRIAIVGAHKAQRVDVCVAQIELYR